MEAIILAGGLGTRLRSVVDDLPKPMAPVSGLPFMTHILNQLDANGIRKVIIAAGYKSESIEKYFGDEYRNLELIYSLDEALMGTGGALKQAMKWCVGDQLILMNGDSYLDFSRSELDALYDVDAAVAIFTTQVSDTTRYGSLQIGHNGKVEAFLEKGRSGSAIINAGVYKIRSSKLPPLPDGSFSWEHFLSRNICSIDVASVGASGFFIDIGIPDDYFKAQMLF